MSEPLMKTNLITLIERFRSEDACREYLEKLRWPEGVACPRCASQSVSELQNRDQFDCNSCRYQFSVTSGTIFHDTKLPLWKWFVTIYLMIESKKGISANQIKRTVGVSYKTAWYLCHRIRAAMSDDDQQPLLKGVIQVDETWVGGKKEGAGKKHGRRHMATVVGAVASDGAIELKVVNGRDRETLHAFINRCTDPTNRTIVTDGWHGYEGFSDKPGEHIAVPKESGGKQRGRVVDGHHTQTIESVWSLLKRSLIGSYHKVSVKHLDAYLDELEWRYNNRENPFLFRDTLLRMVEANCLQYQVLTGNA